MLLGDLLPSPPISVAIDGGLGDWDILKLPEQLGLVTEHLSLYEDRLAYKDDIDRAAPDASITAHRITRCGTGISFSLKSVGYRVGFQANCSG